MRKTAALAILLCLSAGHAAAGTDDVETRIKNVEHGLLPSLLIEGGPRWTLEERMGQYGVPGLCIAVIRDFRIEWVKGYGVKKAGTEDAVTPETLFQAASISKSMTSVVTLALAERGVIDIDEDVNAMLRSWKVPENEYTKDEKVTIRRILDHTSGLTVGGFRGYDVANGEKVPTIIEVLDGKDPSNSPAIRVDKVPGESHRYSGGGFTVLQLLLEDVTGRKLSELASEIVFTPLEMDNSTFEKPLPEELYSRTSAGHLYDHSTIEGYWFLPSGSTCCGLWTTPEDLAKFVIEMQLSLRGESNRILSKDMTEQMLTPADGSGFALGMFSAGKDGERYFTHSGGNRGFKCVMIGHVKDGYGAAIMTNSDLGEMLYNEILRSIASEYGWKGFLPVRYRSIGEAVAAMRQLKKEDPDAEDASERHINIAGYEMMQAGRVETALELFGLNIELYPRSANCYDSFAEACARSGDTDKAIEYYKRALEILKSYPRENENSKGLNESIPPKLDELRKK